MTTKPKRALKDTRASLNREDHDTFILDVQRLRYGVNHNGVSIYQGYGVKKQDNTKFTFAEFESTVESFRDDFKRNRKYKRDPSYRFEFVVNFGEKDRPVWRSSGFKKLSDINNYFIQNILDSTYGYDGLGLDDENGLSIQHIASFDIVITKIPTSKPAGGCSGKYNDCLYDILKRVNKCPWNEPKEFKTYLKLKRNDMVSIDRMNQIEKFLKICIYIYDNEDNLLYDSQRKTGFQLKILLNKDHYSLFNNHQTLDSMQNFSFKDRLPLIYEKNIKEDGTFNYKIYGKYDIPEPQLNYISSEEFKHIFNHSMTSKYVLIKNSIIKTDEGNKFMDMQTAYENFVKEADEQHKASNGLINRYRTGDYLNTAKILFFNHFQSINPPKIEYLESQILELATGSGLLHYEKGYCGEAWCYDIKSSYPSIMMDSKFKIAVDKPDFIKFNELPEILCYGIYNCIIEEGMKLFQYRKSNWYCHYDLQMAKKLNPNVKIELVMNNEEFQFNSMIYPSNRENNKFSKNISSSYVYGPIMNFLYKLKDEGISGIKPIINSIWGLHSQKAIKTVCVKENETIDLYSDNVLIGFERYSYGLKIKHLKAGCLYESNLARIKPFLLSAGRAKILNLIHENNIYDSLILTHTDSIISSKKLDIKTGEEIGDLSYKWSCQNYYINHISDRKCLCDCPCKF